MDQILQQAANGLTDQDLLDKVTDLYFDIKEHKGNFIENKQAYNWFVDVYNFRRGKIILTHYGEATWY